VSRQNPFGSNVEHAVLPYGQMLADGSFDALLARLRPDAVVDILQADAAGVHRACEKAEVRHLVFCGSLWMLGRPKVVPTPEVTQTECPFDGYRKRYAELLDVLRLSRKDGLAVSAVLPEGKGGRSLDVHREHQRGVEVVLPRPGTNLIGPCDAEDVARGFACALNNREAAAGEAFNVGAAYALTAERFIGTYAEIHGASIPIRHVDTEAFVRDILPPQGAHYHFTEHMCPDISRIRDRLGYRPAWTPEESMERAVGWMKDQGLL